MENIPSIYFLIGSIILAFYICFRAIPAIVHISKEKRIFDSPNHRSSHITPTPSLGGIAIFFGFSVSALLFSYGISSEPLRYTLISVVLMFGTGIKDDILVISASKKFLLQFFAAMILVFIGDIRIVSLYGIFGIGELSYVLSTTFSVLSIMLITNSLNLIDGIDGLSSGITIIITTFFAPWFYIQGHIDLAIIATSLLGSAIAFFYHNVYARRTKIFMGDTGSLIIGMIVSVLAISFMNHNAHITSEYVFSNAPIVAFGVLIIPLFDTLRVFTVRILNKKSPFSPDKNHLHHLLLALGLTHIQSTVTLLVLNVLIITIVMETAIPMELSLTISIVIMMLFTFSLKYMNKAHVKSRLVKWPIFKHIYKTNTGR